MTTWLHRLEESVAAVRKIWTKHFSNLDANENACHEFG